MTSCLIIGGTGMLAGVAHELARRRWQLAVVARAGPRLVALAGAHGPHRILPIARDWHEPAGFASCADEAQRSIGPIDLAVIWMHADARRARAALLDALSRCPRVIEVCPSTSPPHAQPAAPVTQRVWLGCTIDDGSPRWLTHDEISAGVLDAIDRPCQAVITVGVPPPGEASRGRSARIEPPERGTR